MSSYLKAELAATCSTLGHLHKGSYLIEPECFQSVKDLIHYLKRDNKLHTTRRYLGESKVLQNDLIQIIKNCPKENTDLFGATLRLLINLTTPTLLLYGEDVPFDTVYREVYLSLVGYSQDYKAAFCDVEFWNVICGKLTDLFEVDWVERSADDGIQIERILMLLRNVLQVPADLENEKRPDNDVTVHDKILWTLRQSQILELLLFISSNKNEEQYFLNLLEIFSIILREQNPKLLASCDIQRSAEEKNNDTKDLIKVRESERMSRKKYFNVRNFNSTFVLKGAKSLSNRDVVCHKSLDKVNELDLNNLEKKQIKAPRTVESDRMERRSTFFVRLFLKEFCLEFLNCSFRHFMNVVKNKLDSGKTLANDETYYFWALKFFLDFATATNSDVDIIKDLLSIETFHFVQTNMDNAFEHLMADKNKTVSWVKRIHLILKAYRSLLETLLWMDFSVSALTRSMSRAVKCQIFYVVEYREMILQLLLRHDPTKFSLSYLRDLIETTHVFIKLLEEYSKQEKLIVQRISKKRSSKKKRKKVDSEETREEKWERLKDDLYDTLCSESAFPEIPPFDAALDIPIDDQKGRAMKRVQEFLHEGRIKDGIGLLRSARQVWPENDYFGFEGMSPEDEVTALREICLADLEKVEGGKPKTVTREPEEEESEPENEDGGDDDCRTRIVEQEFDIMEYKKRLVNRRVIEGCGILLRNYKGNSDHTNHCVIKLLHRIGWECCMPAMLFQASLFWTLLKILKDSSGNYNEIHTFAINLLRKFRKHATKNPIVFLELLFWKEHDVALEIQHGYEPYTNKPKALPCSKKKKSNRNGGERVEKKSRKKNANSVAQDEIETDLYGWKEGTENNRRAIKKRKRNKSGKAKEQTEEDPERTPDLGGSVDEVTVNSAAEENLCTSDEDGDEGIARTLRRKKFSILDEEDESDGETRNRRPEIIESEIPQGVMGDTENFGSDKNSSSTNSPRRKKTFKRQGENSETLNTSKYVETECNESASNKSGFKRGGGSGDARTREAGAGQEHHQELVETAQEDFGEEKADEPKGVRETREGFLFEERKREFKEGGKRGFSEDSEESKTSTPKRLRFVDSDSEAENFGPGEGEPIFASKGTRKRKRFAVIDSDSNTD